MRKQQLLPLFLFLISALTLSAQKNKSLRYWETGIFGGSANYSGEITSGGDIGTTLNETRFQAGIFLKRNFSAKFNLGAEISYGRLFADDANHGNAERGHIMKTSFINPQITMDINFKKFGKYFKRNGNTPFITAGFGALVFQPTLDNPSQYPIEEYELYPGSNYTSNFMLGFGWKWKTGERGIFGASINYNSTGTQYLEGFKKKGITSSNDAFYGIRLFYSLGYYET